MGSLEKGLITKIALKNFVTFDEVVVRPGKNLNLIIGPNGTGKSTLVCAIVLGLGGKTSICGRGDHISTFVKHGQSKATIAIDLQNGPNKYVTIERIFDLNNHTTWLVNKKATTQKVVQELMKSLNIQVDNLCQFLPQDKVQKFSELANRDLLFETERSVGNPKLLEYHTQLKELRLKQSELEKELASLIMLQTKTKQEYDSMKDNVGQIKEQNQIKKKIKQLNQKKAWVQYQMRKEDYTEAKKGKERAEKEVRQLEKKLEPVVKEMTELKRNISTLDKTAKQYNSESSAKSSKLNKFLDDIEKSEKNIDDLETDCKQQVKQEEEYDMHINQLTQQINMWENDLKTIIDNVGSEPQLNNAIDQFSYKMDGIKKDLSDLEAQKQFIKDDIEKINRKIKDESSKLNEISNVEEKRLQVLNNLSSDAYKGVCWLRQNKHMFSAPVYEPILLHINLKNPKFSQYFENHIAQRDLTAFVCENKRDMNTLVQILRDQQKLKINAVHSDPNRHVNYEPNIPLENLKPFGFEHYLISLIDVPETIMKYLVYTYRLNNIPIGNDNVTANIDKLPSQINRFFSTHNVYSVNISRYTKEKSISQSGIFSRGILSISIDQDRINNLQIEINKFNERRTNLLARLESYKEQHAELNAKYEAEKSERNKLVSKRDNIKNLIFKINKNRKKKNEAESNRSSVDDIRSKFRTEIEAVIMSQLKLYEKYDKLLEDCFKNIMVSEEIKLQIKLNKNQLATKESDTQDLRDELKNAEANLRALEAELTPLKDELKKLYRDAEKSTNGIAYGTKEFEPLKQIFNKLPSTLKEIFEEIQATGAKIFSLSNDPTEAEKTLERFRHVKSNLEKFDRSITEKEEELTQITEQIFNVKGEWIPMLEQLVEKINDNFSHYFSKMKCAGVVSLSVPDNQCEFDKYGLKIKVKFRDADELQELTRNHQSGGERAVTTAVYMIALQELTRVPFRCVDEINQGMDATNERRVFDLIVNITTKSNSSQYFMLTPKLLPNLNYNDSITVLTVFNGRWMLPSTQFDLQSKCKDIVLAITRRRECAMEE